jgi:hypothetical protein
LCINAITSRLDRRGNAGAARAADARCAYLSGPYKREGRHTAPSNEAFDASLRRENPAWGVRDLEAVVALFKAAGFEEVVIEQMPANNLSLVFRKAV